MLGVLNLASETILLLPAVSEREVSFVSTSSSASSEFLRWSYGTRTAPGRNGCSSVLAPIHARFFNKTIMNRGRRTGRTEWSCRHRYQTGAPWRKQGITDVKPWRRSSAAASVSGIGAHLVIIETVLSRFYIFSNSSMNGTLRDLQYSSCPWQCNLFMLRHRSCAVAVDWITTNPKHVILVNCDDNMCTFNCRV